LDKGLGGSQCLSGRLDKENKYHPCLYRELNRGSPAHGFVFILTELFCLLEDSVLRGLLASKMEEVTGGLTKLHSKVLHNLYSLPPNIIRLNKSRRIRIGVDIFPSLHFTLKMG
jgi:hypothetical protein